MLPLKWLQANGILVWLWTCGAVESSFLPWCVELCPLRTLTLPFYTKRFWLSTTRSLWMYLHLPRISWRACLLQTIKDCPSPKSEHTSSTDFTTTKRSMVYLWGNVWFQWTTISLPRLLRQGMNHSLWGSVWWPTSTTQPLLPTTCYSSKGTSQGFTASQTSTPASLMPPYCTLVETPPFQPQGILG